MSNFNTRLYLEGYQADLSDNVDINSTYTIDDVKDLTRIASDFTKTITLPGTANNSKLFNFLFDIKASNTVDINTYTGPNIGYNYSFVKKAKAVITKDGAIVFDGYAKLVSATNLNGLVTYEIQISSELTSLVSILGSNRLQDLYTGDGVTPYDHVLNLHNVRHSWELPTINPDAVNNVPYPFGRGVFYPLADYGDYDTVNATNFYLSTLRACLFAKTYWDEIFNFAGYTYSSNFLNSDYFNNLIIPYKDGEMLRLSTATLISPNMSGSTVTQSLITRAYNSGQQYIYNQSVPPTYVSQKFSPTTNGSYNFDISFNAYFTAVPNTPIAQPLMVAPLTLYGIVEVYNADNSLFSSTKNSYTFNYLGTGTYSFNGLSTFTSPTTHFEINVSNVIMAVGQYAKIAVNSTFIGAQLCYYVNWPTVVEVACSGTTNYTTSGPSGEAAIFNVSLNDALESNTIHFSQFVLKDVPMIDFVTSILRLFNLYPVQDRDKPRHFNIYTRDEFYSNQIDTPSYTYTDKPIVDWTNKLDESQPVVVTPIPNLNNSRILFSYLPDTDWYNTLYTSIYGTIYGQLIADTGYEFSQDQLDILGGIIFSPTPVVQYGSNGSSDQTFPCELTFETSAFPFDISTSGYAVQTSGATALPNNPGFVKARECVQVIQGGRLSVITEVYNPQSFQISNPTVGTPNYGTFTYYTNNDKIIPAIYQTSDQNVTRKPLKVNPRILYFGGMRSCNTYCIQNTPVLSGLTYVFPSDGGVENFVSYPFCSHLNDDVSPTNDLLFNIPVQTFFPIANYPSRTLFENFFVNQLNELTDPDAKMLTANFKLNAIDITNRDLSNSIFVKGTKYRINQIVDYVPDDSITTKVELIRQPGQEYQAASIELINQISGTTTTSEMDLFVDEGSGTLLIQSPGTLIAKSISGSTSDVHGTLQGVPFGMGNYSFDLKITAPAQNWLVTALQNNGIVYSNFGIGSTVMTIPFDNINIDDKIVIQGIAEKLAFVQVTVDNMSLGSLSGVTANGDAMIFVSGNTLPMTAGQTAMFATTHTGSGITIAATYGGFVSSGSTMAYNDTHGHGSTQNIVASSGSISWGGQTINALDVTTLNVAGAFVYLRVNEDVNSHSNFTSFTVNGVAPIYISGQTLPMTSGTTALYKTPYTGTQVINSSLNVSASGDTWAIQDTNGTNHPTVLTSSGSGVSVNTATYFGAGGTAILSIVGFTNGAVSIQNSFGAANITTTNIPGLSPAFTGLTGSGAYSGVHTTTFTAALAFTRTGTVPTGATFHARLYKNGVEQTGAGSPIQADSTSFYTFGSVTFNRSDSITFSLST